MDIAVENLSNDELYAKLKQLGFECGPVMDATRPVYQRKLVQLLQKQEGGEPLVSSIQTTTEWPTVRAEADQAISSSEESDPEDEGNGRPPFSQSSPARLTSTASRPMSAYGRTRTNDSLPTVDISGLTRRPLRQSYAGGTSTATKATAPPKGGSVFNVKLVLILVFVLIVAYVVYLNMESVPDPLKAIGK